KVLIERGGDPNVLTKVSPLALVQADENGNPLPPPGTEDANRGNGARGAADQPAGGRGAGARGARGGGRSLGAASVGGLTGLHFAAREGQMDAIRELVAGGANVNLQSGSDKTPPMTEAIINGHLDLAKYLLDHGADPKVTNADGLSALYATVDIRWR